MDNAVTTRTASCGHVPLRATLSKLRKVVVMKSKANINSVKLIAINMIVHALNATLHAITHVVLNACDCNSNIIGPCRPTYAFSSAECVSGVREIIEPNISEKTLMKVTEKLKTRQLL